MSTYVHLSVKVAMLLTSHAAIIVININMSQVSTCVDYLHNYSCLGRTNVWRNGSCVGHN